MNRNERIIAHIDHETGTLRLEMNGTRRKLERFHDDLVLAAVELRSILEDLQDKAVEARQIDLFSPFEASEMTA